MRHDGEGVRRHGREPVVVQFEDGELVQTVESSRVQNGNLVSTQIQMLKLERKQVLQWLKDSQCFFSAVGGVKFWCVCKFPVFGHFSDGLFSIWLNFEPALAIF